LELQKRFFDKKKLGTRVSTALGVNIEAKRIGKNKKLGKKKTR